MDTRFSLGLVSVLILAAVVGVAVARTQPQPAAARAPTPTPTPLPTPLPLHVNIDTNPAGNPVGLYDPATITVHLGQKVTWVNRGTIDQTVTFDDGSFNSGVLTPGEQKSWRPTKRGTYTYSSFLYPDMHGVVIVKL